MNEAAPTTTVSKMFVNFPVKSLDRSIAFFKSLGFAFNPQFTDDNAGCLVLGEHNYAMLLTEPFFAGFTTKKIADATKTAEVAVALLLPNREAVDKMVHAAIAAGGKAHMEPADHGFMYQWGFEDLDGHVWEPFWMDPNFVQPASA
jgi:predicted lactoylglutathione lyase